MLTALWLPGRSIIETDPATGQPRRRVVANPTVRESMRDKILNVSGNSGSQRKVVLALADLLDKVRAPRLGGRGGVPSAMRQPGRLGRIATPLANTPDANSQMLNLDPDKRITVAQAMRHPFITGQVQTAQAGPTKPEGKQAGSKKA